MLKARTELRVYSALKDSRRAMRIGRALSLLGRSSRREGELLVLAGRVTVNGLPVLSPATLVDPGRDALAVDGEPLARAPALQYYAVHKPRGVVSTVRDPHAHQAVVSLVPAQTRLYPVGRLDKDSEGLILLTNDGDFAQVAMHPRHGIEKEYEALVPRAPDVQALGRLRQGVDLGGRLSAPARLRILRPGNAVWLRMVLREGRHHEVRRMLAAVGLPVLRLVRTRIGPIRLGRLAPGEYRELRPDEIHGLMAQAGARPPGSARGGSSLAGPRRRSPRARTG